MPYDPNFADEDYCYEYGGYVDPKRRGAGDRGRVSRGRRPTGYGGRGRYMSVLYVNFTLVE